MAARLLFPTFVSYEWPMTFLWDLGESPPPKGSSFLEIRKRGGQTIKEVEVPPGQTSLSSEAIHELICLEDGEELEWTCFGGPWTRFRLFKTEMGAASFLISHLQIRGNPDPCDLAVALMRNAFPELAAYLETLMKAKLREAILKNYHNGTEKPSYGPGINDLVEVLGLERTALAGSLGIYKSKKAQLKINRFFELCFALQVEPRTIVPTLEDMENQIVLAAMNFLNDKCAQSMERLSKNEAPETVGYKDPHWGPIHELALLCMRISYLAQALKKKSIAQK